MPSDETIKGLDVFTEQPVQRTKELGRPWKTTRTFVGPQHLTEGEEDLLLLLNPLSIKTSKGIPATITIETEDSGGTAQIGEQIAISEVIWELDWERVEKDIRTHGWFIISGSTLTYLAIMEEIDLAIKKGIAGFTDYDSKYGVTHMNDYKNCRLQGLDSYIMYSPVVRATVATRSSTPISAPGTSATKIVTWANVKLPIAGVTNSPGNPLTTSGSGGIGYPKFERPKIHYLPNSVGTPTYSDADVNEWMVAPAKAKYEPKSKRWSLVFEWYGAEKWTKCLYDGGSGYPPS